MLAKLADAIPAGGDFLFEPKWDGFRAIVFRAGTELFIQSRDLKPLDRFPVRTCVAQLPDSVWSAIVIATPDGSPSTRCRWLHLPPRG